ncbi:uncharacterized protein BKA55DRAFT_262456 [Fusarium redolens]|uniref:Uncharacterized protein n=1 Tax=Fusarium redolens TaxID=48865 RepID=A0A9P9FYI0_FUSRE|nr:uncharacterized protein BKA55DRAFT_262456 [Fusarium redolens]KAH7208445.1 hypothetical protein BKA55DRAFT_262456 [Fusarium redolens]
MIFDYLHDTANPMSIQINYTLAKPLPYRDIRNLLYANKCISNCTISWLYNTHELLFNLPTNDLPYFISYARENTLDIVRKVKLHYSWGENWTLALNLLRCCKSLQSLKISSSYVIPKRYLKSLRLIRVKTFEYNGTPMQEMQQICQIVMGNTEPRGTVVKLSREEILEYHRVELYLKRNP